MKYGYKKQSNLPFKESLEKIKKTLKSEGFGIITEIDVKKTLKEKLGIEYENYIILGACNPNSAHEALQIEKEVGLLLPCNVVVYKEDGNVYVSAILPTVAMSVIENDKLAEIARMIELKLKRAIDKI